MKIREGFVGLKGLEYWFHQLGKPRGPIQKGFSRRRLWRRKIANDEILCRDPAKCRVRVEYRGPLAFIVEVFEDADGWRPPIPFNTCPAGPYKGKEFSEIPLSHLVYLYNYGAQYKPGGADWVRDYCRGFLVRDYFILLTIAQITGRRDPVRSPEDCKYLDEGFYSGFEKILKRNAPGRRPG